MELNLRAYQRSGQWLCMAEPEAAQFQDLRSSQLQEQPLAAVLERAYANLVQDQSGLSLAQRADVDRQRARVQLQVLVRA